MIYGQQFLACHLSHRLSLDQIWWEFQQFILEAEFQTVGTFQQTTCLYTNMHKSSNMGVPATQKKK